MHPWCVSNISGYLTNIRNANGQTFSSELAHLTDMLCINQLFVLTTGTYTTLKTKRNIHLHSYRVALTNKFLE